MEVIMSKANKINKAIDWIAIGSTAYFVGLAIAGAIKRKREQGTSGIGWAQAYASRNRILSYFDYPQLIDKVDMDLTEKKGKYVDATVYFKHRMPAMFWISPDDARWLSSLCDKYDVEFNAWNGNTYLPTLHK